jgi:hypothetical protein
MANSASLSYDRSMIQGAPSWFWTGVEALTPDNDDSQFRLVVAVLHPRRSSDQELLVYLMDQRARFRRWLHQDEFGPRRAQQAAALRTLMKSINKLRKQLQIGSWEQRRHLDAVLRDRNVPASTIIEAIYEAAMDAERCLRMAKAPQIQIDWAFKLQECADSLMAHLYALDTNAEGEVFLVATRTGFDVSQAAGSNFSLEKAESWLDSVSSVLFETLGILSSRGGAEGRVSLKLLVEQLCQLWEHETQSPTAAHGIVRNVYQSRAVTDAGQFVAAAVEAMLPNESWFAERPAQSMRAMTFLPSDRPARERQILGIMRDFVRRREWSSKDALPEE